MKTCPSCHNANVPDDAQDCPACGVIFAKLKTRAAGAQAPAASTGTGKASVYDAGPLEDPRPAQPKKGSGGGMSGLAGNIEFDGKVPFAPGNHFTGETAAYQNKGQRALLGLSLDELPGAGGSDLFIRIENEC